MPNSIQRDTDKKEGWPMGKIASYCFDIEGAKGTGITDAYHATAPTGTPCIHDESMVDMKTPQ